MIRASVPKLNLDDAFEQKNEIAKAVEEELEKVTSGVRILYCKTMGSNNTFLVTMLLFVQIFHPGHVCLWLRDRSNTHR